jgi:hypothetical protein
VSDSKFIERGANADTCGQRCSILHSCFPRG